MAGMSKVGRETGQSRWSSNRLPLLSPIVAERRARALALEHAGALAFSRTGDPTTGEFQDAVILARFGEVDLDSLGE